jgi:hypothetical protein
MPANATRREITVEEAEAPAQGDDKSRARNRVRFVLLDETAGATTQDGGALTPTLLAKGAALLTFYLQTIIGKYRPAARDAVVRAGSSPSDIQDGEWPFHIGATFDKSTLSGAGGTWRVVTSM